MCEQNGPAMTWLKSAILVPANGCGMARVSIISSVSLDDQLLQRKHAGHETASETGYSVMF
jgi:hypothetical protein